VVSRETVDTEATLKRHVDALMSGDIDSIMSNFTDESVVFMPDGKLEGLAEIRSDTVIFLKNNPPETLETIEVVRQDIAGEFVYLLWKSETSRILTAETYVIRNGKILAQTFAVLDGVESA
jgi:hypothetical protein